jgi:hypothetical protein
MSRQKLMRCYLHNLPYLKHETLVLLLSPKEGLKQFLLLLRALLMFVCFLLPQKPLGSSMIAEQLGRDQSRSSRPGGKVRESLSLWRGMMMAAVLSRRSRQWVDLVPIREMRRRLFYSPAHNNDLLELELPGAWEPQTIRGLCLLVKNKKPDLVFLMETKLM